MRWRPGKARHDVAMHMHMHTHSARNTTQHSARRAHSDTNLGLAVHEHVQAERLLHPDHERDLLVNQALIVRARQRTGAQQRAQAAHLWCVARVRVCVCRVCARAVRVRACACVGSARGHRYVQSTSGLAAMQGLLRQSRCEAANGE
jgi:hypothetical protein